MPPTKPSKRRRNQQEQEDNKPDMLQVFHGDHEICSLPKTSTMEKKNVFASFRPQEGTYLDYHISQTDAKLDAGDTKIHVRQTEGTYDLLDPADIVPPSPPKIKKIKYSRGGPPQWVFIDEIWRQKQDELQKYYRWRLKKIREARVNRNNKLVDTGLRLVDRTGPDWFQELSPNQLEAVDNLSACIKKDLREGTYNNTQLTIANLGLVLRPNHRHIQRALKECCRCSVEFLLVLYQLVNPKRTEYSVNDRILLSAVAHLTMQDTMRELHVRIPSPPRQTIVTKTVTKKKRVKYDSPYLEPFTFQPPPRKYSGVYYNKHCQRPESPYFDYLIEFKKRVPEDIMSLKPINPIDNEIIEELKVAQEMYSRLVDFRPIPTLQKPTSYRPCFNLRTRQNIKICQDFDDPLERTSSTVFIFGNVKTVDSETESFIPHIKGVTRYRRPKFKVCRLKADLPPEIPEDQKKCHKLVNATNDESCGCNITGNHISSGGCECNLSGSDLCVCGSEEEVPPVKVPSVNRCICEDCSQPNPNDAEESEGYDPECCKKPPECDTKCGKKASEVFVITAVKVTMSGTMIPVIEGLSKWHKVPCKCADWIDPAEISFKERFKHRDEKLTALKEPGEPPDEDCLCKKVGQHLECPCKRCQRDREKQRQVFHVMGLKEGVVLPIIEGVDSTISCVCKKYSEAANEDQNEDQIVPIIQGVDTTRPCVCMRKYVEKCRRFDEYASRIKAVQALEAKRNENFIVGGVSTRFGEPVYMYTGVMSPRIKCKCPKVELDPARLLPKVPSGRIQYEIAGVRPTPDGNVFILNSAVPIEDCACMDLYAKFEGHHVKCMKMYDDFLQHMKECVDEFMEEFAGLNNPGEGAEMGENIGDCLDDVAEVTDKNLEESVAEEADNNLEEADNDLEKPAQRVEAKSCVCLPEPPQKSCGALKEVDAQCTCEVPAVTKKQKSCGELEKPETTCGCAPVFKEEPEETKCNCGDPPPVQECTDCSCAKEPSICEDCNCLDDDPEEEIVEIKPPEKQQAQIKRFVILNEIPCDADAQREILKKVLERMAADGFPLAKLPEAYRLPHLRLWMQMRCGKFWTQEEKRLCVLVSKGNWKLVDYNRIDIPKPQLPWTKKQIREMNWNQAEYVRKTIADIKENYYRAMKQSLVNYSRALYPTTLTFAYEFPFRTFRDSYFAYTASKEEDVTARFVWQPYEIKNFSDRKSCLC